MSQLKPKYPANMRMNRRLLWVGGDGDVALNLGAGINPIEGAMNHDLNAGPGIDVTFNITDSAWPLKDSSFQKVFAFHVLEHLPVEKVLTVFKESYRILVAGGLFIAEVPDIKGLCEDYLAGNMGALRHIYAADRLPGDPHRWGYSAEALGALAYASGYFQIVTTQGTDYHAEQMKTLRLEAVKSDR